MTTDTFSGAAEGLPDTGRPSFAERAWSLVPVVVLRQAGFPLEMLAPLVDGEHAARSATLIARRARLAELAAELKTLLRAHRPTGVERILSRVGQLRPIAPAELGPALDGLPGSSGDALREYQSAVTALAADWAAFEDRHRELLDAAGDAVARAFAEEPLREVLLLSNDAAYPTLAAWLDGYRGEPGKHTRKMADLLTMYLQRVTTKNETHSHFGPFTVGRVGTEPGVTWSAEGPLTRTAFFTHWAAERLAVAAGEIPGLAEHVRPRRRPLSFLRDGRVIQYAFTTRDGLDTEWNFRKLGETDASPGEQWLWQRADGTRTVGELRARWSDPEPFDEVLRRAVRDEWLIAEFEIPVGESRPLSALRALLPRDDPRAAPMLAAIDGFEQDLLRFSALPAAQRPALLAAAKQRFQDLTGVAGNRNSGLHYADRSILFEEARGRLRGLTIGPDLARFVTDELAVVYELVLAGPRLRMRRELDVLTRWVRDRFGDDTEVPLDQLYARSFADREHLVRECAPIEAELADLDDWIVRALLGPDTDRREVEVPRDTLEAILGTQPAAPSALCNPDVLFAARSRDALRRGDFTAVIGDCHAVREVLTHTSFSPLVQEVAPDLLPEVHRGYLSLLDDDEVLVNLSRGHPDKSSTQLVHPCHDLEVYGRSPQTRDRVLQPSQLYLVIRNGRLELRARGVEGRIRLMAPPAGGPSILQDPLSPFAFPRHFGGVGLRAETLAHVPRIRCGRVILQRETWRVPSERLRGLTLTGDRVNAGDAAQYLAACLLRAEYGLPRHVFVKVSGEPKPIYVDWEAPLLVRQLCRVARRAEGTMEVSEMLPAPEERWLDVGGHRYTTELRCAVFSPGRPR
ncbi:lantibiotic dehydratase [Micromonospora okii]|uniref:lantibiotic dehydratase n=1 Tax=Micromonospora okii TaxID=1182970 RepID=UPI001E35B178|nr:lantibiotic dehydratase [Micromonospora okii]